MSVLKIVVVVICSVLHVHCYSLSLVGVTVSAAGIDFLIIAVVTSCPLYYRS